MCDRHRGARGDASLWLPLRCRWLERDQHGTFFGGSAFCYLARSRPKILRGVLLKRGDGVTVAFGLEDISLFVLLGK